MSTFYSLESFPKLQCNEKSKFTFIFRSYDIDKYIRTKSIKKFNREL